MPSAYDEGYRDKKDKAGAARANVDGLLAGLASQTQTSEKLRKFTDRKSVV